MATVILDGGWFDDGFVTAKTSLPFLVSNVDGKLLRASDAADAPYLVWDGVMQSARAHVEAASPVLEGRSPSMENLARPHSPC